MSILHILFCILVFLYPENFNFFTFCVFMNYFVIGFTDSLAEGMSAVITKLQEKVKIMEGGDMDEEDSEEGEAIGFFFVFRTLIRTLAIWVGGILTSRGVSVGYVYLILAVFPGLLLFYSFFIFKEERV